MFLQPITSPCVPPTCREPGREQTTIEKVQSMISNPLSVALARENGMEIQTVSWEDTARCKNSCWGPNISDMTLQVRDKKGEYHRMPVIRNPNFADKTSDISIDAIKVKVGNEVGSEVLTTMTLRQYINEIVKYALDGTFKGPMLREKDEDDKVIYSAQTCFLPLDKEDPKVRFNVALYNYQTSAKNPAVLVIVISSKGASAQILDEGTQHLMFNKKGMACDFVAESLTNVRTHNDAVAVQGPMSDKEDEDSKLYIVQIPLKVPPRPERAYPAYCMMAAACAAPMLESCNKSIMDYAQISVGEEMGPYKGLNDLAIERDTQFPIRVTEQLYKVISGGDIDREQMTQIIADLKKSEEKGKNGSSLVLEQTKRPTEWIPV